MVLSKYEVQMYKRLEVKIGKYSDGELSTLIRNMKGLDKLTKRKNTPTSSELISFFSKPDKRTELVKVIDHHIPPFTDNKIKRDNRIIDSVLQDVVLKKEMKRLVKIVN